MRPFCLLLSLIAVSCTQRGGSPVAGSKDSIILHYDSIPATRGKVSARPVASYSVPIDDPAYGWRFAAEAYETKETFRYLLHIQYKAMFVTDTVRIPDFGIYPTVQIHKGPDALTCIVGFLDKKGLFREYKLVSAKGDKLKITVLKSYFTGIYKTRI